MNSIEHYLNEQKLDENFLTDLTNIALGAGGLMIALGVGAIVKDKGASTIKKISDIAKEKTAQPEIKAIIARLNQDPEVIEVIEGLKAGKRYKAKYGRTLQSKLTGDEVMLIRKYIGKSAFKDGLKDGSLTGDLDWASIWTGSRMDDDKVSTYIG